MGIALNSSAKALRRQVFGGASGDPPIIQNHPTQSITPIDGWKALFFGLPVLLAGIFINCVALDLIPGHKSAPDWLIALITSFFFLPGACLVLHGLRGVLREAAHGREIAAQPSQPWLADYHWNREGISFSAFRAMLNRLLGAVSWYVFLIPFFWIGLNQHGMGRIFLLAACFFAAVGLIFWVRWFQMLLDLLPYGDSFLAYDCFPYFLGNPLNARLRVTRHLDALDELRLTLRCVQERYVTRGTGENRTTQVVCFELYKEVATFSRDELVGAAQSYLPISFRLPDDQPATSLSDTHPIYWEIEAQGKAQGADYEAYFLLPVYRGS